MSAPSTCVASAAVRWAARPCITSLGCACAKPPSYFLPRI